MASRHEIDRTYRLVVRAQQGDREALDALLRSYDRWIRRVVRCTGYYPTSAMEDMSDLLQLARLAFVRAVLQYQHGRGSGTGLTPLLSYAERVIRRRLGRHIRAGLRRRLRTTALLEEVAEDEDDGDAWARLVLAPLGMHLGVMAQWTT